ncbi:MAG: tetratricopeptide repeat protein [Bacteroidota bacterium]
MFQLSSLRLLLFVAFLSIALIGCGGSGEAAAEDEMVTDTGISEEAPPEEIPAEEETITEEQPAEEQPAPVEQPVQEQPAQPEGPTKEQLQGELDAIKTENMQLKDENSGLQQSNRDLTNKISDLEAANAALATAPKKSEPARIEHRAAAPGSSSAEEIRAYEGAVGKTKSRNYRDAMNELQMLLNSGIKDDYADNCHYWLGECSFQLKDFSQAIQHFQLVQGYKYSEKRDDAQLMIARSYELLGDRSKARSEYQKLVDMYPTSEYIRRARAKLR